MVSTNSLAHPFEFVKGYDPLSAPAKTKAKKIRAAMQEENEEYFTFEPEAGPAFKTTYRQLPDVVWQDLRLSDGAVRMYLELLKFPSTTANGYCFPTKQTLATNLGIGEREAYNRLKELQDVGAVGVKATGRANRYYPKYIVQVGRVQAVQAV